MHADAPPRSTVKRTCVPMRTRAKSTWHSRGRTLTKRKRRLPRHGSCQGKSIATEIDYVARKGQMLILSKKTSSGTSIFAAFGGTPLMCGTFCAGNICRLPSAACASVGETCQYLADQKRRGRRPKITSCTTLKRSMEKKSHTTAIASEHGWNPKGS